MYYKFREPSTGKYCKNWNRHLGKCKKKIENQSCKSQTLPLGLRHPNGSQILSCLSTAFLFLLFHVTFFLFHNCIIAFFNSLLPCVHSVKISVSHLPFTLCNILISPFTNLPNLPCRAGPTSI